MSKFTPALKAKGIYTLREPFANISAKVYQCAAVRSFQDYLDLGESAFDTVYNPAGLTQQDFENDQAADANIVTLVSDFEPTILVPDTYIVKYPDLEYVGYNQMIVSAALGPLPDALSLDLLQSQIAGVISDVIGVTPVVRVHTTGSSGVITLTQHELLETARTTAISNRISDRARYLAAAQRIGELEQRIRDLEDAIIATQ